MDEPVRYSPALQTAKGGCRVRTKTRGISQRAFSPLPASLWAGLGNPTEP